jgi:hypothetical protein
MDSGGSTATSFLQSDTLTCDGATALAHDDEFAPDGW